MHFRGLRLSIAGNFGVLLAIGMLLVNVVVVLLWQQELVRFQARQSLALTNILSMSSQKLCSDREATYKNFENICSSLGAGCVDVLLYNGFETASLRRGKQIDFIQYLTKVTNSGEDLVELEGPAWGIYSPGNKYLFAATAINNDCIANGAVGIVQALHPLYKTIKDKQGIVFVYILVNVLVLSTIGLFRMSKLVVNPLQNLVRLSENFSDSETSLFTLDSGRTEFSKLSMALNTMLARIEKDKQSLQDTIASLKVANEQLIESQQEMIRAEKLAAVGRLSAGLAHEIGNPVGIVQGYLELLGQENLTEEERKQFSERAGKEVKRINKLVYQLLDFTRPSAQEIDVTAVHEVLAEICEMLTSQKDMESIKVVRQFNAVCDKVVIGRNALHQVLLNCLLNAIDAIKEKGENHSGTITIKTDDTYDKESKESISLQISDDGVGIEENKLDNIFDPFFTTKAPGKGTGLGLSVSNTIIEAAKGKIRVISKKDDGTSLVIDLPLSLKDDQTALSLKE